MKKVHDDDQTELVPSSDQEGTPGNSFATALKRHTTMTPEQVKQVAEVLRQQPPLVDGAAAHIMVMPRRTSGSRPKGASDEMWQEHLKEVEAHNTRRQRLTVDFLSRFMPRKEAELIFGALRLHVEGILVVKAPRRDRHFALVFEGTPPTSGAAARVAADSTVTPDPSLISVGAAGLSPDASCGSLRAAMSRYWRAFPGGKAASAGAGFAAAG